MEDHFKKTSIDNDNRIIISISSKERIKNGTSLLHRRKVILKYLLLKKEAKLNKNLKIYFENFIKLGLNQKKEIKEKNLEIKNYEKKIDIEELKIKKLRDLVRKKIFKQKEILHRIIIKYYYRALYIHLHWYMYVVNQLSYIQNNQNTSFSTGLSRSNSTIEQKTTIDEENNLSTQHGSEVNKALRESIRTINKINSSENPDNALKESIMSINKINDKLSKEAEEKKKAERNKHLKDLVTKKLKDIKNEMNKMFTKFFYQGKLLEKKKKGNSFEISLNEENNIELNNDTPTKLRGKKSNPALDRRNRARNLRKLMIKKEKERIEQLKGFFHKFHTNGMLFVLKKNSQRSLSSKNISEIIDEEQNKKEEDKKKEEKELTYMDKVMIEKQKALEELKKKRKDALLKVFYKLDRQYMVIKKKVFENWNLRAKILSLSKISKDDLKKSQRKKKLKKSTRKKKIKDSQIDKKEEEEKEEKEKVE